MADDCDKASEIAERHLRAALATQLSKGRQEARPATGLCPSCGGKPPKKARFCGAECRDDFETARRKAAINGN